MIRGGSAQIEITQRGEGPAAPLAQARAASGAMPVGEGDLTIVEHHLTW